MRTFRALVPRHRRVVVSLACVFAAALVVPSIARAQVSPSFAAGNGNGFDLHLFHPAVDSKGQFSVNGTDILGAGDISFGLVGDVGVGMVHAGVNHASLVSNSFTALLAGNIGIANVLVIGAQVPVSLFSGTGSNDMPSLLTNIPQSQYSPPSGGLSYQGLGDITLHAKLRWLRAEYYPIGLALILQGGWNPMNASPSNYGSRSWSGEPGGYIWPQVAIERRALRRLRFDLNVGARIPFQSGSTIGAATMGSNGTWNCTGNGDQCATYGPSITWGLGASFRAISVIDLVLETYGMYYLTSHNTPLANMPWEVVLGAKIFVQRNSYLMIGGGTRITGLAAADVRAFLGIVFEPSIGDTDGDGYRDDVDQCVNDPEDFDNFQDEDGCSDPDNDRDGIPDVDDQCPNIPEDHNGVEDRDGCPESQASDRDGDGIADNVDRCPDDPEDRDGFQDQDGCPDPDNDEDGIPDTLDNCPNDPEDIDGFQDDDGCPDPDNDEDRILDVNDRCPNQPEVYNGVEDDDGCPDSGDLQILGNVISLRQQIQFETDSAEIRPVSFPIIEQMAELLRRNAQFELVEVEGHTDERAPDEHNLRLSNDRANSVMQALVTRGISPGRLVAAGYGELCPLDPAHNARAWERNRRVQFVIVRTHDEGRTTAVAGCHRAAQYIPATIGPPGTGVARESSGGSGSPAPGASSSPAPNRSPAPTSSSASPRPSSPGPAGASAHP